MSINRRRFCHSAIASSIASTFPAGRILAQAFEASRAIPSEIPAVLLDGGTAFIGTGESIPIRERSAVGGVSSQETIGFQETISGFYAIARVQGNRVTVQLAAAADTVIDRRSGAAHIQRVTTVVSGKIGEWIEVGGINEVTSERQAEIASRRGGASRSQKRIYIKVEEIR